MNYQLAPKDQHFDYYNQQQQSAGLDFQNPNKFNPSFTPQAMPGNSVNSNNYPMANASNVGQNYTNIAQVSFFGNSKNK